MDEDALLGQSSEAKANAEAKIKKRIFGKKTTTSPVQEGTRKKCEGVLNP